MKQKYENLTDIKKYEELTFADDYMFCIVLLDNPDICIELTEMITGRRINRLLTLENQKSIKISEDGKGIRFDVYFADDVGRRYDIEMQTTVKKSLSKRTRYYISMLDADSLKKAGEYKDLPESYVVFICLEDPFDRKLCKYSFNLVCNEDNRLIMHDGTNRIFLNAAGKKGDISDKLRNFLKFLADRTNSSQDQFTQKIAEAVLEERKDVRRREKYMFLAERDQENIERGKELGKELGKQEGIAGVIISAYKVGRTPEQISEFIGMPYDTVTMYLTDAGLIKN